MIMNSQAVSDMSSGSQVDAQSLAELFHLVRSLIPEDQELVVARPHMIVSEAIQLMQRHNYSQLPVVAGQAVLGVFSFRSLTTKLLEMGRISEHFGDLPVDEFMEQFKFAQLSDNWESIIVHLDRDDGVLVGHRDDLVGILTPMDVLSYLRDIANPFVLLAEIELSLRRIVGASVTDDELQACAEQCLSGKYPPDEMPTKLSDMTFNDYVQIIGDGRNWPHFEVAFGAGDWLRKRTAKRLKEVRELRNDVFHFKRRLLPEDIETLAKCREWLQMKTRAFEAKRREETPVAHADAEMADPFCTIFLDREEADWAFDLLRETLFLLGVTEASDKRFALTLEKGDRILRLKFGEWWGVLRFAGPDFSKNRVAMALIQEEAELAGLSSDLKPLDGTEHRRPIRVYRFPMETARPLTGRLRKAYENTFSHISERFANLEESKYRKHHVPEIAAAVFDRHKRAELLTHGIAEDWRDD
jgi:CBS domain-containing protein